MVRFFIVYIFNIYRQLELPTEDNNLIRIFLNFYILHIYTFQISIYIRYIFGEK